MVVISIFDYVIGTVVSEVRDGVAKEGDHSEKRVKKNTIHSQLTTCLYMHTPTNKFDILYFIRIEY